MSKPIHADTAVVFARDEYERQMQAYREAVEHIIATEDDPVPALAALSVPNWESCIPHVTTLDEARERVEQWNTVSANPTGTAGLVAIIPDLTAALGAYSDDALTIHVGADVDGGLHAATQRLTHHLLMLAAIALAYAETGRLLPDAYGIDAEWLEGGAA